MPEPLTGAAPIAHPVFRQPQPVLRWLAVALALTGAYASVQLERVSYGGAASTILQQLCGGEQQDDCRSVLMSSYGSVRLGDRGGPRLPVATIGTIYFVFIAIWNLFIGPVTRERRYVHLIILGAVVIGALMSLDYMRVMATVLRQWCGGCIAVHAINGAILLVTIMAWPWRSAPAGTLPHPHHRLLNATLAAGAFAAAAQFGFAMFFLTVGSTNRIADAYERVTSDPAYVIWNHQRQPHVELPEDPRGPLYGESDAPHTVVVFTDFTCPRCKVLHGELEKIAATYAGRVRIDYRNFPLDPACNPHPKWARAGHRGACDAATTFELVRTVDPDTAVRHLASLFDEPHSIPGSDQYATGIGAEREKRTAMERVRQDIELGASLGLNDVGTPVVYLDGRRFDGWQTPAAWESLLSSSTSKPADSEAP